MIKLIYEKFIKKIQINKDINKMYKYYKYSKTYNNKIIKKIWLQLSWKEHNKIFYKYSCDIDPNSTIGKVIFRHPLGIVIGRGAIIEDGVIIHQNVTLGALKFDPIEKRGVICQQIIGKNTIICAGAKILGDIKVGKNCIIGANAVVTKDIPNGATVVGYNKIILKGDINVQE